MVEEDIEETVDVLMKATTDRLVLVSTPDDGNHVRFDIRPLQEFFAAEFLYESVDVEELRNRIELIAGDAHWREVLHFLLSALIENERRTELAVAVEILENLNEGNDDNLRLLYRRLGRGAIPAARLLHEGVLEQDKRIRQQFRKCLEPLAASTELDLLKTLMQVNQRNSRRWLYHFLISHLQESKDTESIGAAIILSKVLPDEHEKVEEVSKLFLSSHPNYLSCVISSYQIKRDAISLKKAIPVKNWFIKIIVKVILSEQWASLTEEAFSSCVEILRSNKEEAYLVAEQIGLEKIQLKLFRTLINTELFRLKSRLNNDNNVKDYGIIEVISIKPKWIDEFSDREVCHEISSYPEIINIIHLILCFIKFKKIDNLIKVLDLLSSKCEHLAGPLLSYTGLSLKKENNKLNSINRIRELISIKINITDQDFNILFNKRYHVKFNVSNDTSLTQWKIFVNDYPEIAIYLLMRDFHTLEKNRELLTEIVDKILIDPEVISDFPFIWGFLLEQFPEREQSLRQAFIKASSLFSYSAIKPLLVKHILKFYSFNLNFPSEVSLLPYLVYSLINYMELHITRDIKRELEFIKQQVSKIVDEPEKIKIIFEDTSFNQDIRAAAIIAYVLHPKSNSILDNVKQQLVEFYDPKIGAWYIKAIAHCLCLLTTEENSSAKWIISNLLDATRTDYEARKYLQRLLTFWRETSSIPIQKAGVQE
ncbi:MAG: hypothetical protein AAFX80_21420, partial [Cyanobacteria bacterium J06639_18]